MISLPGIFGIAAVLGGNSCGKRNLPLRAPTAVHALPVAGPGPVTDLVGLAFDSGPHCFRRLNAERT